MGIIEKKYESKIDKNKWKVGCVYMEDFMYKHAKILKYAKYEQLFSGMHIFMIFFINLAFITFLAPDIHSFRI